MKSDNDVNIALIPIGTVNEIMATANLERTFIRVNETDNSVEICVLFRGLGVAENTITIIIFTQDGSAIGMSQFMLLGSN